MGKGGGGERGKRRNAISYHTVFGKLQVWCKGLGKTEFRVLYHPALSTTWQGNKSLRAIMFSFGCFYYRSRWSPGRGREERLKKKIPLCWNSFQRKKKKKKSVERVSKASIMPDWVYYSNYHREKEKRKKRKKKKKKKKRGRKGCEGAIANRNKEKQCARSAHSISRIIG